MTINKLYIKKYSFFRILLLILGHVICIYSFAQKKVIQYDRDFVFKDGIYLTMEDFKNNHPIPSSKILFNSNKDDRDFLKLVLANHEFKYIDSSRKEITAKTNSIWGYCANGTIHINYGTDFNRIVIIGGLCHFVATIATRVSNDPLGNMGYGFGYGYNNPAPRYVYSTQQFFLDFESGRVNEYNPDNMELFLQERDISLFQEFSKLKRRQKKDAIFLYLRKYNQKHPVYFPE